MQLKNITLLVFILPLLASCGGSGGGGSSSARPDLRITASGNIGVGSTLIEDTSYDLVFTIHNDGNADVGPGWSFKAETSNGDVIEDTVTNTIPAGGSVLSDGDVVFLPENTDIGSLTITLTVDSKNEISESDEGNNSISENYTVVAKITSSQ